MQCFKLFANTYVMFIIRQALQGRDIALQHEPARRHKDPSPTVALHRGQSQSSSLSILTIGQVTNNITIIFCSFTVPQSVQVPAYSLITDKALR